MPDESPSPQRILLVTGLSGAGKSTALQVLEDLGWEALDNFPIRMLGSLVDSGDNTVPVAIGFESVEKIARVPERVELFIDEKVNEITQTIEIEYRRSRQERISYVVLCAWEVNTQLYFHLTQAWLNLRARMALRIGGASYEHREVVLRDKPPEMLEVSPKGTVPVLVLADGSVIDESSQIMRWALDRNDPEGWLERDDAGLIERNDGPFKHDLDRYKYPDRHDSDALEHRQRGMEFLTMLDARLADHAHLCGSQRGIVDAAIMPFVRQFAAVDSEWFAAQPIPRLQNWLVENLASSLFEAVMLRVAAWQPGEETLSPSLDLVGKI